MLLEEILASVDVIRDPDIKIATYARLGLEFAKMDNPLANKAFKKAFDVVYSMNDPFAILRNLAVVAYYMGKANLKSSKRIFQRIKDDLDVLPKDKRDLLLVDIVNYLVDLGEIDEATYHALGISDKELRNEALVLALKRYLRKISANKTTRVLQMRKAEYIWEQIESEPYYSIATVEIIKAYLRLEEYDRAIFMISYLKSKPWIKQVVREVITHLKKKNISKKYYEKLVTVAVDLSERLGINITRDLIVIFALNGEVKNAVSLIRGVEDPDDALKEITKVLIARKPGVLPKLFESLSDEELNIAAKELMNYLLDNPHEEFKDLVAQIPKRTADEKILVKIVGYYLKLDELESAVRIGAKIKDVKLRSLAFGSIAHYLLKRNMVEDAIDLVIQIKEPKLSSQLVSEILVRVAGKVGGESIGNAD
ncbi:hypothetical protein [Palaeococcus pacificus]|nr:hypothetical protein [Palaeococcus pacificus]